MALWGKTDDLAGMPKYVARKAYFVCNSTNVSASSDNINILASNTGFATGDAVVYDRNSNTAIGGLTSGNTYYVRVIDAGLIELYDTYAHAINTAATTGRKNITSAGSGTQILQRTGAGNTFGDHVFNGRTIVFVDNQEAQVTANRDKGIKGPGWWAFRTYTDAQSNTRYKTECLIAFKNTDVAAGDDEDTVAGDLIITIDSQPEDAYVATPDPATFLVEASINGNVALSYQWQIQQEGTGSWTNITGATEDSYTTGATASGDGAGATDGDKFRVIVSGGGVSTTSDAATLTTLAITISAQPDDEIVVAPDTATFSVTAAINGPVDLDYQWQIQQEGTGSWTNITGATSDSYTTGATAVGDGAGATDGDKFRVIVSGGGVSTTSDAVTLTVTAE